MEKEMLFFGVGVDLWTKRQVTELLSTPCFLLFCFVSVSPFAPLQRERKKQKRKKKGNLAPPTASPTKSERSFSLQTQATHIVILAMILLYEKISESVS